MFEDGSISISVALTAIVVTGVFAFFYGLSLRREPRVQTQSQTPARVRVGKGGFLRGLEALVDEPSHRAVDALLVALDVDDESVDTHLALGALLRWRGDVDKALRLHQNLLARPRLSHEHRGQVELELARDQLAAGSLDRAVRLLRTIVGRRGPLRAVALDDLFEAHLREREWQDAIDVAVTILESGDDHVRRPAAQALCEMGEASLEAGDALAARKAFAQALEWDGACVRASLALGRLEVETGRFHEAIRALGVVPEQDPRFVTEAIEPFVQAHRELGAERDLGRRLERWQEAAPSTALALALAELAAARSGEAAGRDALVEALVRKPTARGLNALLERQVALEGELGEGLLALRTFSESLVAAHPPYACDECGRTGEVLHWQCPSCGHWGSTAPVQGLVGD